MIQVSKLFGVVLISISLGASAFATQAFFGEVLGKLEPTSSPLPHPDELETEEEKNEFGFLQKLKCQNGPCHSECLHHNFTIEIVRAHLVKSDVLFEKLLNAEALIETFKNQGGVSRKERLELEFYRTKLKEVVQPRYDDIQEDLLVNLLSYKRAKDSFIACAKENLFQVSEQELEEEQAIEFESKVEHEYKQEEEQGLESAPRPGGRVIYDSIGIEGQALPSPFKIDIDKIKLDHQKLIDRFTKERKANGLELYYWSLMRNNDLKDFIMENAKQPKKGCEMPWCNHDDP